MIPSLDGIRAISVLIVFLSHAGLGNIVPGGFGVTTFFFLSGYLITTLLIKEYDSHQRINFKYFFIRRFYRLFPPLLLTLIISYLLVYAGLLSGGISLEGALAQILYFANYHSIFQLGGETPTGTGILWSLAVEEHFYLLFPFIFYFIINNHNRKAAAQVLFLSCIAILIWRIILVHYFSVEETRTYYATDTRIDSIIFGCILALSFNPVFSNKQDSMSIRSYVLLAAGIAMILFSFLYRDESFRETYRYTVQGIGLAPLFYLSIKHHTHPLFHFLNINMMKKIGQYSYFIYLIHFIVINTLKENSITDNIYETLLIGLVISISYAFLVDTYFDKYFRRLRKLYR